MMPWYALIVREWLEHRGAFGWGPAATFVIVSGFLLLAVWATGAVVGDEQASRSSITDVVVRMLAVDRPDWSPEELSQRFATLRVAVAEIFAFVYFLTVAFTLLGMLYDERKDRSVLFWKSMPVGDAETVLAKLATAVWIAPIAAIAATVASWLVLVAAVSMRASGGEYVEWTDIWQHSGLLSGTVDLFAGYLVQGFWALPLYGWLLFVSAAVNRAPLLWATLVPGALAVAEALYTRDGLLVQLVRDHFSVSALPDGVTGFGYSFGLFATARMWGAIAIGALFVGGAIVLRRRKNEI
jgi:ABC-2 type transport system permease protein